MKIQGPGSNFELLLELAQSKGMGLPESLRAIYGGDWVIPEEGNMPYSYSNFVISHDGKVSFNLPGHEGGGDVSGFNSHDQWFMALARARADAVVVGANTLRTEHEHQWTAEFIFPKDAQAFGELRKAEGRKQYPLQVIVTQSGEVNPQASIFHNPEFEVLIATSDLGAKLAKGFGLSNAVVRSYGAQVDLAAVYRSLSEEFSCRSVLCEGGPRLYAAVVLANLLDDEFLTISPRVIGAAVGQPRPGLIDGFALTPENKLHAKLRSVRRAGDHLFVRTSWR